MQTLSQCATGYCEYRVDETQRSEEYCYMFLKRGCFASLSPRRCLRWHTHPSAA